ncbi:hypothetical protein [Metabacillus malikii]|uniref:Magnesium-transporting ATPase (P-type) n=1 Tax=Metabacillus malikii TaxID=1504265 RepID=A0ABT9ZH86_9BACI|nr:hypothetical protein [Metabacillus malikii]MDQ0231658.1 magnesium-transporting ATPase (P-type) [Metabacillus malikii]
MKSINLTQKLLLIIYLIAAVVLGSLTADEDFIAVFDGSQIYLWYSLLTLYYGVLMLITVWIVSYLTLLSYKLANKQTFDRKRVMLKSMWLLIITFYAHMIVLYINHYIYSGSEILLIFIIPAVIVIISIVKDINIQGFKKVVAIIPLSIYIGFDALSIYLMI